VSEGDIDLAIDAAAGWAFLFTYCVPSSLPGVPGAPVNVTGWHAKMTIRSSYGDGAALTLDDQSLGGITVGTTDGSFNLAMTAEQTMILPQGGVYDILVTPPGNQPIRLAQGKVTVSPFVTRPFVVSDLVGFGAFGLGLGLEPSF
jgi:hypothetical protein